MECYLKFWGKAGGVRDGEPDWHPLAYHCLDVAAVADGLLERSPRKLETMARLLDMTPSETRALLVFLIALHDLGKFTGPFQVKSELAWNEAGLSQLLGARAQFLNHPGRHDLDGWLMLHKPELVGLLTGALASWDRADLGDLWAAVTGHHGKPANLDGALVGYTTPCSALTQQFCLHVLSLLEPPATTARPSEAALAALTWLLAGLTVVADWIGSNRIWFPYRAPGSSLHSYWQSAKHQAAVAIGKAGILPVALPVCLDAERLLPAIAGSLSPAQQATCDLDLGDGPSLTILEDVTGAGKTEAALLLAARLMTAGRADGLFFALPTMATANAMYDRLYEVFARMFAEGARPSLVLAHGRRVLNERFSQSILPIEGKSDGTEDGGAAACAAWIADDRRKAFLAHVGVGTIDQALLGVLPTRHQVMRLWGLADRVLIIDEAHAYDAYMSREMETLLEFQAALGGSAIILSATLPDRQRRALAAAYAKGLGRRKLEIELSTEYPLLTHVSSSGARSLPLATRPDRKRRLAVRLIRTTAEAVEHLCGMADRGAAVAWIRNTVDDVLEAARLLTDAGHPPIVLHARFAMGDRLEIEANVKEALGKHDPMGRRRGFVVVGSQILEQSLDYDVDAMISDLAPLDFLIQRAGRLWRHTDRRDRPVASPELLVLSPDPGNVEDRDWYRQVSRGAAAVYGHHGVVWRSANELHRCGVIETPGGVRRLVEAVYGPEADRLDDIPEPLRKASQESAGRHNAARSVAGANLLKVAKGYGGEAHAWTSDRLTPTRLGEEQTVLRLGKFVDGAVVPWIADVEAARAWALSEVSVRKRKVSGVPRHPLHADAIARTVESWPKWDRDLPLLLLEPDGEVWRGIVVSDRSGRNEVLYGARYGLQFASQ